MARRCSPSPEQLAAATSMAEVRRLLGPTAWCALEALVTAAGRDATGRRVAVASVRGVAADLGVSKNTAHRALVVLRRAGLIRLARQDNDHGRFSTGRYVLNLKHDDADTSAVAHPAPPPPSSPFEQLSLLPNF